jgi:hypothetical protein
LQKRSSPVVCVDHVQLLQSSLSHESDKIPIACCKVDKDLEKPDDLEELRNLTIKEMEGSREIQDTIPSHTCSSYNHPLKLWKVNIGSTKHPKIASIGDYWDEKTMNEVHSLLWEYEDLFPKNVLRTERYKRSHGRNENRVKT